MADLQDRVKAWVLKNQGKYQRRAVLVEAAVAATGASRRTVHRAVAALESQNMLHSLDGGESLRAEIEAFTIRSYPRYSSRGDLRRAVQHRFGVSERYVRKVLLRLEQTRQIPRLIAGGQMVELTGKTSKQQKADAPYTRTSVDQGKDTQALASDSTEIKSVEELLTYFQIDETDWVVERSVVNKWDMGFCVGTGEGRVALSHPLYQIKVWLKRRTQPDPEQVIALVRESLENFSPEYPRITRKTVCPDKYMVEISIPDFHYGSLCWGQESGERYDLNIAKCMFNEAVDYFISGITAQKITPEMFVFPVGNDFFNVNSMENITVHNTRQDEDDRWQKSFLMGRDLVVGAIDRLVQVAPVKVLIIPGNHDLERIFYLGTVLEAHYRLQPDVEVDASPTTRKYLRYGNNLLGFAHGKDEKLINLPTIMAREAPRDWGDTQYREVHVGHLHQSRGLVYMDTQEFDSVRVRLMPTLCARNSWATAKGLSHLREGLALVWDKRGGCVTEYKYHVPDRLT